MVKHVRRLVRGRGRKIGGEMFYEVGSHIYKKRAKEVADVYRNAGYKTRVVRVKSAVLHLDKRNYPFHIFVRGRGN